MSSETAHCSGPGCDVRMARDYFPHTRGPRVYCAKCWHAMNLLPQDKMSERDRVAHDLLTQAGLLTDNGPLDTL